MMKHMMVWLLQVTYADTHPMFSSTSYPHFFRVVPSDNEFNEPRLALLKQYNWTRVGTLYQNQARYSLVSGNTPQESCSIGFTAFQVLQFQVLILLCVSERSFVFSLNFD